MSKKKQGTRGPRIVTSPARRLRRVLAENLKILLERDYPLTRYGTSSDARKKLAEDVGTTFSSVQRMLNPERGKTLDLLADFAVAFHLNPCDLLEPLPPQPTSATSTPNGVSGAGSLESDPLQRSRG